MCNLMGLNEFLDKVSKGISQKDRPDLQDAITRRTIKEVSRFEASLSDSDRKTFFWALFRLLSPEAAFDLLNRTYIERVVGQRAPAADKKIQKLEHLLKTAQDSSNLWREDCKKAEEALIVVREDLKVSQDSHNELRHALWVVGKAMGRGSYE